MNSRERVTATIKRTNPDRVPIDLGGTAISTIYADAYDKLLKRLNINKPIKIADTQQFFVYVEEEIAGLFNTDIIPLYGLRDFDGFRRDKGWKDWKTPHGNVPVKITKDFNPRRMEDGSYIVEAGGFTYKLPPNGFYFDYIKAPLQNATTVKDIEDYHIPIMDDEEKEWYGRMAKKFRAESDKFIVADIVGGWTDIAGPLMENANFYMSTVANKPVVHALMEKLNDVWKKRVDILHEVAGDNVDAVIMYNDLGGNEAGIYSNQTVREMFIPYIKDFYEYVRKISNYYIIFHSDGSIYQYIPDLIDAGVDILNPVQVGIANMEPERLKSEFGKHLTFWGGAIDPQHVLSRGTEKEVRDYAVHCTEVFKEGGGFIFTQPHNIQADVPPENIIALYESGNEYGRY
jgi:uroporphyrinogen decarboxylase